MENKELTRQQARYLDILSEFNFQVGEVEESLFERVHAANKTDELCSKYRLAIAKNAIKLHGTCLHECQIVDGAIFKNNLL